MENSLLVHKHLIIRAEAVTATQLDEEQLTEWMKEFIESIRYESNDGSLC
jgi:TorA maturation chaperone TorD